ncbi:hypothetical protein POPTR_015G058750v4 [Populus trichocarpa]|uniref:Uncharacterized protein n=1 Tax=Populus trichocarpa TaxID=3694 RepID=A0ACC0RVK3_POPTR|nr:hypothetical protein POPTR_015G058750v4 [Populus trichocarpa]
MRPLSIIQKGKEVRAERVELQPLVMSTDSHSALVEHCKKILKCQENVTLLG